MSFSTKMAINRRTFIAVGTAAVLSGCVSSPPPLGLREIELGNATEQDVTVDVTVEKSDQTVYDATHELGPDAPANQKRIKADWMGDRAYYEVTATAHVSGEEFVTRSNSESLVGEDDYADTECFDLFVRVSDHEVTMGQSFKETCESGETTA